MSDTKHTPGPWRVSQGGRFVQLCIPGTILNVCEVSKQEHTEANARLIAAAPDLLKACQSALANLDSLYPSDHLVIKRLRTAIAKAQGQP